MTEQIHGPDLEDLLLRSRRIRRRRRLPAVFGALALTGGALIGISAIDGPSRGPGSSVVLGAPTPATPSPTPSNITPSPQDYQPPPSSFPEWGVDGGCPDSTGLRPFTPSEAGAVRRARALFGGDVDSEYAQSDRAFWPVLQANQRAARDPYAPRAVTLSKSSVVPGVSGDLATYLAANCGTTVVRESAILTLCEGECGTSPALDEVSVWLERGGHWLLWYQQP